MHERVSLHLDIDGCFNVRDAGGWPTGDGRWMRTGVLYRADDPLRLSATGRKSIDALGLEAVVDLRQPEQVALSPGFADPAMTYHLPLGEFSIDPDNPPRMETPEDLQPFYEEMVRQGTEKLVEAVNAVADHIGQGPVLVHCAIGKDRTGIVVALIQAAIGVPGEALAEEYALSHEPTIRRRREMLARPLSGENLGEDNVDLLWTAPAEAMALFARRAAEQYGSLERWPLGLGVPQHAVDRLQQALVVDEPDHGGGRA